MTYEKQTWTNGDVITAEKLNHMEDGIKDNENKDTIEVTFFTHCNNDSSIYLVSSSHTVEEVQAFIKAGKNIIATIHEEDPHDSGATIQQASYSYYEAFNTKNVYYITFYYFRGSGVKTIYGTQNPGGEWYWGLGSLS